MTTHSWLARTGGMVLVVALATLLSACSLGGTMDYNTEAELVSRIAKSDTTLDGVRVADLTDFEWDTMCAFREGAEQQDVKDACGFDTGEAHFDSTPGGGIVFTKDGKVVGLYGLVSRNVSKHAFLEKFGPDTVIDAPENGLISFLDE